MLLFFHNFFKNMIFTGIKLIKEHIKDWKEAIGLGVDLLVENAAATNDLKQAIIEVVNQHGPYFVIAPKLALAHAPPKNYCLKPALSLVVFKNSVSFGDTDRYGVNVLVTLSATDNSTHIDLMAKFAKIFGNKTIIDKLVSTNSIDEIKNILKEFE